MIAMQLGTPSHPCPWCHDTQLRVCHDEREDFEWTLKCTSCGATGPRSRDAGRVVKLWNSMYVAFDEDEPSAHE